MLGAPRRRHGAGVVDVVRPRTDNPPIKDRLLSLDALSADRGDAVHRHEPIPELTWLLTDLEWRDGVGAADGDASSCRCDNRKPPPADDLVVDGNPARLSAGVARKQYPEGGHENKASPHSRSVLLVCIAHAFDALPIQGHLATRHVDLDGRRGAEQRSEHVLRRMPRPLERNAVLEQTSR